MNDMELAEEIEEALRTSSAQIGRITLTFLGHEVKQIIAALRRGPEDIVNLKNKAQVMHDLHDALSVKWGCDPYAEIRRLKGTEKLCEEVLAQNTQAKARIAELEKLLAEHGTDAPGGIFS